MSFGDFATIFPIIFGGFFYYFHTLVQEQESVELLITKLNKFNYFEFYRQKLEKALDIIDNYLGKPSWNLKYIINNISFHYTLAILYVFITFLIVWLMGGSGSIGTLKILPTTSNYVDKIVIVCALIFILFIFNFIFSDKFEKINKAFKNKFNSILPQILKKYSKIVEKLLIFIVYIFIFIYHDNTLSYSIVFSSILAYLLNDFLVTLVLVVVMLVGVSVGGVVVGVVVGVGSLLNNGNFLVADNISLFIFLLLIPFLNAILDFLSLLISRYFQERLLKIKILF